MSDSEYETELWNLSMLVFDRVPLTREWKYIWLEIEAQ